MHMFQYLKLSEANNYICEMKLVFFGFVVSRSEVNLLQPISDYGLQVLGSTF